MSGESYVELREYINKNSIGFPETSSGVGVKILKRLFSEEDVEIVLKLKPSRDRETADQIAKRTGLDKNIVEKYLESLSKKGLLFRIRRGNTTVYNLAPFMIGLYEYSVQKIDEDLAQLYREYFDTKYIFELGKFNMPGFKVIPIEETVEHDTVLVPYQKLKQSIREARVISVAECIC
ncbi:MAG: helix-turn-helix domain-containing protein, partial [Promethearchaeota archaeon]